MSLTKSSAAKSAIWSLVENGGLALVSFGSLIIYSRFLTPTDFGIFSMVLAFVEILSVLVSMLFHDALVQQKDVTELHFDTAFTFSMILSVVLLLACILGAPLFARLVGNASAAGVLRWTALALPCTALSSTIVPRQRRKLEFRALALRSLVGRLAGAGLGVILVVMGAHFWGLVAQYVLVALVGSLVLWSAADEHPKLRFQPRALKSLWSFSLYSVGGLFLNFATTRIFMIAIGASLGAASAGYLNLSFRIVDVLWAIAAAAVSQAALPVLAQLQSDTTRLKRAYGSALEFTCLTLFPCFIGIAVTAPEIVELLFGRAWLVSSPYVTTFALLIVIRAPRLLTRPVLTAVGRPQDALIGTVVDLLVMMSLMWLWGAKTLPRAAAIWCCRELVPMLIMAYILKRVTGIRYGDQIRGTLPALAASGAMVIGTYLVRHAFLAHSAPLVRFAVLVPAGATIFVAIAWLVDRTSIINVVEFISAARGPRGATQPVS